MVRPKRRWLAALAGIAVAVPLAAAAPATAHPGHQADDYQVLVFTKTDGERRASIDKGVNAIRGLGAANHFTIDVSQNSTVFTADNLANYRAVVFLNTTGDVLTTPQETAFQQYVTAGGGYVGVHAAAETEPDWTFYRGLVGTGVSGVASTGAAPIEVTDRAHPATEPLARQLTLTEEW